MRRMTREQFILLCKAQALITEAISHSEGIPSLRLCDSVDMASGLLEEAIKDYVRSCSKMSKLW